MTHYNYIYIILEIGNKKGQPTFKLQNFDTEVENSNLE